MNVRRLLLSVLVLALASGDASGQRVRGDLIVGMSRADFHADSWHVTDFPGRGTEGWSPLVTGSLLRPMLGVGASAQVLGPLWLRAEAVTVTKGYSNPRESYRALFLELPLLVEVLVPWRGDVRLRAVAGVAPSAEVSCSAHLQLPYGDMWWIGASLDYPVECDEQRVRNDVGRVYGFGFGPFGVAGLRITPEIRVVTGSYHSSEEGMDPRESSVRLRHRTVSAVFNVSR